MSNYLLKESLDGTQFVVRLNADGSESWIPMDPANADYQAYLNRDNPDWGKPQTPQGVNE
jgi:hypothetical protein